MSDRVYFVTCRDFRLDPAKHDKAYARRLLNYGYVHCNTWRTEEEEAEAQALRAEFEELTGWPLLPNKRKAKR